MEDTSACELEKPYSPADPELRTKILRSSCNNKQRNPLLHLQCINLALHWAFEVTESILQKSTVDAARRGIRLQAQRRDREGVDDVLDRFRA